MKNRFFTNEFVRFANIVLPPQFAGIDSMEDTVKNKFFTNEFIRFTNIVLMPKFAGIGSMEDYYGIYYITKWIKNAHGRVWRFSGSR